MRMIRGCSMGTHLRPREVDGDARILLIFTPKGFLGTLVGIFIGAIFFSIASAMGAAIVGWVLLGICVAIGFIVGQMKIPESNAFSLFKKTGGEYVRDVITKYLAFRKKKRIYLYDQTDYSLESNPVEEEPENILPIQKG